MKKIGVCVTDGYQVYHTLEHEREDLLIAGCWGHARRRYDEALKALPKKQPKDSIAYLALRQIQSIYLEEGKLKDLSPDERLKLRQLCVRPLVEAYFLWIHDKTSKILSKGKTGEGLKYSIN